MLMARLSAALLVLAGTLAASPTPARAQSALPLLVPPPLFRTSVTVRLYCRELRCPVHTFRTDYFTGPAGDVYASDTGILYPLNSTTDRLRGPLVPGSAGATLAKAAKWEIGSSFGEDILTLWYDVSGPHLRQAFKQRIRFHPGTGRCEILSWEQWGLSAGYPLARAFMKGSCVIGPGERRPKGHRGY